MENYRKSLIESIEDNKVELVAPSREYTDGEVIYMKGYNQALQDMLEDFDNDFETFLNELIQFQLN
jgi:effector-binding domain-containing protein